MTVFSKLSRPLIIVVTIAVITIVLIAIAIVLPTIFYKQPLYSTTPVTATTRVYEKKALVYDSLAREYPNERVLARIIKLLHSANYTIDLYVGENATLDPLYRLGEYDLVILRAHGGFNDNPYIPKPLGQYVFTGIYYAEAIELYGEKRVKDLEHGGYIAKGVIPKPGYSINELPKYVTLSPLFFKEMIGSMKKDAIIIYTGCYGLDNDVLANVFLDKGAYAYISFKGNVTWVFGDQVLEVLIEHIVKGEDIVDTYKTLDNEYKVDKYTDALLEIRYRRR